MAESQKYDDHDISLEKKMDMMENQVNIRMQKLKDNEVKLMQNEIK